MLRKIDAISNYTYRRLPSGNFCFPNGGLSHINKWEKSVVLDIEI
jgi:hypothetical protein